MSDVVRGLRQALLMLVVAVLVAAGVAAAWSAASDGGFWTKAGIALMVIAGLLSFTGSTAFSRSEDNDVRALLGRGPDREDRDTGQALTGAGVFLFVSVPLFALGAVLFDVG